MTNNQLFRKVPSSSDHTASKRYPSTVPYDVYKRALEQLEGLQLQLASKQEVLERQIDLCDRLTTEAAQLHIKVQSQENMIQALEEKLSKTTDIQRKSKISNIPALGHGKKPTKTPPRPSSAGIQHNHSYIPISTNTSSMNSPVLATACKITAGAKAASKKAAGKGVAQTNYRRQTT